MRFVFALGLAAVVASCYRPEQNPAPPVELPQSFGGQEVTDGGALPERWWEDFGDPQLAALVEAALSGNFQVKAAWARLEQARATAVVARSPLLPSVEGRAGVSRTQIALNPAQFGAGDDGAAAGMFPDSARFNNINMSLAASYELDVWGRLRSGQKAALLDVASRRDDVEALAISTAAEVVEAWFDLLRTRESKALLEAQIEIDETYLELVQLRAGQGLSTALDVFQANQQVVATRAQLALIDGQLTTAQTRIGLLLGVAPGAVALAADADQLPELPPVPTTGVPSQLLQRRPDVRAAMRRVEAADWRVAQAVADRFPQLTLSGRLGYDSPEIMDPFRFVWSIASNLVAPIFDFGRRAAEVDRSKAVVRELVNVYGQTVVQALVEVENSLALERSQRNHIVELEAQVELNQRTLDEARNRYREGLTDFLPVLNALQALQASEQNLLNARRQLLAYRVQLYRALGGTWTNDLTDPDAPSEDGKTSGGESDAADDQAAPEAAPPGAPGE